MKNVDKQIGVIYETQDYDKFRFSPSNRKVDNKILYEKIKSITSVGLLDAIVVNDCGTYYDIIDGQHRYLACVHLGVPVKYTFGENETFEKLVARNQVVTKWKEFDFIISIAGSGNLEYIKILKFHEKYPDFRSSALSELLGAGAKVKGGKRTFKKGMFVVNDYDLSCYYAEKFLQMKSLTPFYSNNQLIGAAIRLFKQNENQWRRFFDNLSKPKFRNVFYGKQNESVFRQNCIDVHNHYAPEDEKIW